ncbi:hypothetical protein [Halorubrum sp. Eb13]|uniref:hypothetical protein n=1 Tax=Halorubrum sp. Eb13 TaxID=1383843 RepID=UPI000B999E5D|nr:hypothetical protein [Halorubrum sp. Eb13]OYR42889.1 hypothetical protein DJ75_12385 [Halorubrum sp. Eb13]
MTEYKLDLSFGSDGVVHLHVFDLDDPEPGAIETCEVGEDLDTEALRRAWGRFQSDGLDSATVGRDDWEGSTPSDAGEALFGDMDSFLNENQDADEL